MGLCKLKMELNSFIGKSFGIVTEKGIYETTESSELIFKEDVVIITDMVILNDYDDEIDRKTFKIKGKDILRVDILEIFEDKEIHIDLVGDKRMIILGM